MSQERNLGLLVVPSQIDAIVSIRRAHLWLRIPGCFDYTSVLLALPPHTDLAIIMLRDPSKIPPHMCKLPTIGSSMVEGSPIADDKRCDGPAATGLSLANRNLSSSNGGSNALVV